MIYKNIKCRKDKQWNRGFTLIELLTSMSLYTVISISLISTLLIMSNINRRLQNNTYAINSLILSMEFIQRELKMASSFRCDDGTDDVSVMFEYTADGKHRVVARDCPFGKEYTTSASRGGDERLTFLAQDGTVVSYKTSAGLITRYTYTFTPTSVSAVSSAVITNSDIYISNLQFYVEGTDQADSRQTSISTIVKGINKKLDNGSISNREFKLEYTITPRTIDG